MRQLNTFIGRECREKMGLDSSTLELAGQIPRLKCEPSSSYAQLRRYIVEQLKEVSWTQDKV